MEQERPRWGREAADKWAREEAGAARCLVCLKHAGLDPTQERDGKEAAVGGGKRGAQAGGGGGGGRWPGWCVVSCMERGSMPGGGGETAVLNPGGLPSLLPGAGACAGTFWSGSRQECAGAAYLVGAPLAG